MNVYEKVKVYRKVLKKNNLKPGLIKEIDIVLNRLHCVANILDNDIRGK